MFSKLISKALLLCALAAGPAAAATVGTLDGYRTYGASILGGDYSGLVSGLEAAGHDFAGAARDLTPTYLSGVDVFMHGRSGASVSRTYPQGTELADLKDWVEDGGVYVQFGGNFMFASDLNRWSGTFGFGYTSRSLDGGTWSGTTHPYMTGVVAGSSFGASSSSFVSLNTAHLDPITGLPLTLDTFATITHEGVQEGAVLGAQYGNGYVVFFADENPVWGSTPNAGAVTFLDNVLNSTAVAPVPLPAGLPLLLAALGGIGLIGRRKSAV